MLKTVHALVKSLNHSVGVKKYLMQKLRNKLGGKESFHSTQKNQMEFWRKKLKFEWEPGKHRENYKLVLEDKHIKHITLNGEIYASIFDISNMPEGVKDGELQKDKILDAHFHNYFDRSSYRTQEVVYVGKN